MFYYKDIVLETKNAYEPAEDSLLFADIINTIDMKGKKLLDMGTGTGLLAIIASKKGATVTAADIDKESLEIAEKNAENNKAVVSFVHSDLFQNINGKFDIIVFNPPYLPSDETDAYASKRTDYDGGKTGCDVINRFLISANRHLNTAGMILMLISSLTDKKEVARSLENNGFHYKSILSKKIDWEELSVLRISRS